jgi:malate permease and related proteins
MADFKRSALISVFSLSFPQLFSAILPVYGCLFLGGLLRWRKVIPEGASAAMMRLCVELLLPCLILSRMLGNPAVMELKTVLMGASLGFGTIAAGIWVGYFLAPLAGLQRHAGRRSFAVTCGIQNYGYVAIPMVQMLFDDGGRTLGVMFTYSLGVELATWTVGVGMLTGLSRAPWRLALSHPVLSVLLALALNFSGLHGYVPAVVMRTFSLLADCSVPLAVLMIGATMYEVWGQERLRWKVVVLAPALRLLLLPVLFYACAWSLPLSLELKRTLVVQGAMPTAIFTILLARQYGGHVPTAIECVVSTTVFCLFATPLWLSWAFRYLL